MSVRRWAVALLVLLPLCWGGVGYASTRTPTADDYRRAAAGAARSAYHALVTADLVGRARLAGRLPSPYTGNVLDDGRAAVSGAARRFAAATPVDAPTARLRDRLGPLLLAATDRLTDVRRAARAPDPSALRRSVDALAPVTAALAGLLQEYG
ncbi:hypothetical protein O7606_06625 [Micromonospora sp. WMMD882]|uniref:hypothetical protein n=1 Tax=Micromonospora sp. WMMD882 TaxID=3015151 RepID=UPI00248AE941|nr:hypothetical protein [Micromonospora sp. WMMD882]WBB81052.1 hypothetical protein O7606_06625 [Micromonospora sp. WMMD882]